MSGATDRANDKHPCQFVTIQYLQPKYFILWKIKKRIIFYILYCDADGLLSKQDELMCIIEKDQPIIIALSENKPKRQYDLI